MSDLSALTHYVIFESRAAYKHHVMCYKINKTFTEEAEDLQNKTS